MAQQRLPMRKIRDVLRLLSAAGLSRKRQIAASLGIGPTAAGACLRRAREFRHRLAAAGRSWQTPHWRGASIGPDDHGQGLAVAAGLAGDPPGVASQGRDAATGLGRISVPRIPTSYGRSWFCELYRAWEGRFVADDAAGPCGRREAVRRLRRHDD